MSSTVLYRFAGYAGLLSAAILLVNVARRGGAIPDGPVVEAIAPISALAGLFALAGLYLWQRTDSGVLGFVGIVLNGAGLAGAFAIEYTLHVVFVHLSTDQIDAVLAAGARAAFTVTAVTLIVGVLCFGVASWRAGRLPRWAVAGYVAGMVPGALRNVVPEAVYLSGLTAAAVGTAGLCWALARRPVVSPLRDRAGRV